MPTKSHFLWLAVIVASTLHASGHCGYVNKFSWFFCLKFDFDRARKCLKPNSYQNIKGNFALTFGANLLVSISISEPTLVQKPEELTLKNLDKKHYNTTFSSKGNVTFPSGLITAVQTQILLIISLFFVI